MHNMDIVGVEGRHDVNPRTQYDSKSPMLERDLMERHNREQGSSSVSEPYPRQNKAHIGEQYSTIGRGDEVRYPAGLEVATCAEPPPHAPI